MIDAKRYSRLARIDLPADLRLFPEQELTMLIFYVIPVHLRAKMLLAVSAAVALVGTCFPSSQVAHAAHLGGMAMGCLYVSKILNRALLGVEETESHFRPQPAKAKAAEPPPEEPGDADVDAVLDKINARGINSLSARERAILEAARKRMAQR